MFRHGSRGDEAPLDSPTEDTNFLNTLALPTPTRNTSSVGQRLAELVAARPLAPVLAIGLLGILLAVTVLFFAIRYFGVTTSLRKSEAAALVAAPALLDPLQAELAEALALTPPALAPEGLQALTGIVNKGVLQSIRLYNAEGKLLFSTAAGSSVAAPRPAGRALAGHVVSSSAYQDGFGRLGDPDIDGNRLLTWLPLRSGQTTVGILEASSDLGEQAVELSRQQVLIAATTLIVLLALYVAFLLGMRQIGKHLQHQHDSLRRDADRLPAMFRRSMQAEEASRKRIVAELEGRVAQTLATVKADLEDAAAALRRGEAGASAKLDAAVPPLQNMISGVRDVAAALHRPSDAQLGMTEAIEVMLGEARGRRPDIQVGMRCELSDDAVPAALQPVVRRALEAALAGAIANGYLTRLRILIGREGSDLIFRVRDDATPANLDDDDNPYARLHEHVLLSGGRIGFRANSWGGIVIRASWRLT